ncbi:CRTAC1 family protein [Algisphaera agarilytica]|uniref:ASPIC/UnbV domain-containing protein n=1 Tax=Algisphaera agarilytica TaxID=1385975 RepID=A0A7X0LK11_9BACT|nr:CRTAC1 family protein [Algisphaera agarilytica]MBB6429151.1 hypothetical protein [Algisphaera agarilytica]
MKTSTCSLGLIALAFAMPPSAAVAGEEDKAPKFAKSDNITFEDRSRRKWDSALIADLDQNGWEDIIITEHSQRARIYWNDEGQFSEEPQLLVNGDTHGIAAGDYDQDGRIDLVVSRGGGDGSNPRNPVWYHVNRDRTIEGGDEFEHFERARGRAAKLIDTDNNGVLDLVLTAFPLKTQADGADILYTNDGTGQFLQTSRFPQTKWMGFRILTTDFNGDGKVDVFLYGGDDIKVAQGGESHSFIDATDSVLGDLKHTNFVKGLAEIDFDNDGDLDLFVTRAGHPFSEKRCYCGEEHTYYFHFRRAKFDVERIEIDGDMKVENLQMAYPHFDVFSGEAKDLITFDVDRHGHKDFTLTTDQAQGFPEDWSDPGLYLGHTGEGRWRIAGETRAGTSAVVHNVISAPEIILEEDMPALLFENRDGKFVDVTAEFGIDLPEQTTSAAVGDFDNDGWSDIFVVRYGDPTKAQAQVLFMNQKGESFTRVEGHGIVSEELGATGGGAEVFDFDLDGDLDLVYNNEKGRWYLYENHLEAAADRHYLIADIGWSPRKEATPQGAKIVVEAGGHTYTRTVGTTPAAFSHPLNTYQHIGLGPINQIDSATVTWTNGEQQSITIDEVDRIVQFGYHE